MKIDITQFVTSVQEAPSFEFPEMSVGTSYLFINVYCRLSSGEDALLSDLDFDAFDIEDIGYLGELFQNVFEDKNYRVNGITNKLREIAPRCNTATYV